MNSKNWIPWIVAASAMLFAMIVLVRNEITPGNRQPYSQYNRPAQPQIRPVEGGWQDSAIPPAATTPDSGDYSPWTNVTPAVPAKQVAVATPIETPAPTPSPTPAPTPTPKPQHTFRGITIDDSGAGVPRAHVRIITGSPARTAERSAVTGADGRFQVEGIPEDVLDKVIVEAQGYSATILKDIPLPLPDELQIGMSPLAGIDAMILDFESTSTDPTLYSGQMQASLLRLRGAEQETTDAMGISEPVLPVDTYLPVRNQDVVVQEGLLQFDNVEPGRYRVAVKSGSKVAESETLEVQENARTSATLVLGMKHLVGGVVWAADTGKKVAQARVTLAPSRSGSAAPEFPDYLSFTDGEGEFVIPEVLPGRYWMVIGAHGYTTKTLENFEVLPGAPPESTSVTLQKQDPLVTVSVINGENRPMAQAPLVLMTTSGPVPKTFFGKTDEAGLYRFDKLLPGRYSLSITAPGDRTRQKTVSFQLGDGEVKELTIRFGNSVAVTGTATSNDKPYNGLLSFVLRGAAMADNLVTADEDGKFTVDLEPGEYMVGTPDKPAVEMVTIENVPTQKITVDIK